MTDKTEKLSDAKHAGVFQVTGGTDRIARTAQSAGLAVVQIDLNGIGHKAALLDRLAQALSFPEWFGNNWDALNDCLTDLSWLPAGGWMIILEHSNVMAKRNPKLFETAVEVLQSAGDYWRQSGKPFWVLLHGPGDWVSGASVFDVRSGTRNS